METKFTKRAFKELAEATFRERKNKVVTVEKRKEDEIQKKRSEKALEIAELCLEVFSESTKSTDEKEKMVTKLSLDMTESYYNNGWEGYLRSHAYHKDKYLGNGSVYSELPKRVVNVLNNIAKIEIPNRDETIIILRRVASYFEETQHYKATAYDDKLTISIKDE